MDLHLAGAQEPVLIGPAFHVLAAVDHSAAKLCERRTSAVQATALERATGQADEHGDLMFRKKGEGSGVVVRWRA